MIKRTIIAFVMAIILFFGGFYLVHAQNENHVYIKVPDNVHIFVDDSLYITHNDSVKCTYTLNDGGLIIFSKNEYEINGYKLKNNHPSYGYFQYLTEYYFNFEDVRYFMLPKGTLVTNKQADIQNYGIPDKQHYDEKTITLEWNINNETIKKTYDRYGKFLY